MSSAGTQGLLHFEGQLCSQSQGRLCSQATYCSACLERVWGMRQSSCDVVDWPAVLAGTLDLAGGAHPSQLHSMVFMPSCVKIHLLTFTGGTTEAGKRGQSQYAQFLRRSSIDMGQADPDVQQSGMELRRQSSDQQRADTRVASGQSANTTSAAALAGSKVPISSPSAQQVSTTGAVSSVPEEQRLERRPSRVHFVPSHAVQQTAVSATDSVQEAASHGEQMGPQHASLQAQEPQQAQHAQQEAQHAQQEAQHAQQEAQHAQQGQQGPQLPAQPEQRQTNAKRTFQEILREQLQVCGPCVFYNARCSCSARSSCIVQS